MTTKLQTYPIYSGGPSGLRGRKLSPLQPSELEMSMIASGD